MTARRVQVFRWTGIGPGHQELQPYGEAKFHQFGSDYEEFEQGPGNFTTAVIEWDDGQVEMVRADRIRFLEPKQ